MKGTIWIGALPSWDIWFDREVNTSAEMGEGVNPGSGTHVVSVPSGENEYGKDLTKKVKLKAGEILKLAIYR